MGNNNTTKNLTNDVVSSLKRYVKEGIVELAFVCISDHKVCSSNPPPLLYFKIF